MTTLKVDHSPGLVPHPHRESSKSSSTDILLPTHSMLTQTSHPSLIAVP
jgi:hypothetical protein